MIERGDIYFADLDPVVGSEQGGYRPVLIIQNDVGNRFSPTVIVAAMTTKTEKTLPTHINIKLNDSGSTIMLEQLRTLDKTRLRNKIGKLSKKAMDKIDEGLKISMEIK